MRIAVVVYDGFDELDAIAPYEVLRNAAAGGADLEVVLVTAAPAETVTASHGLEVSVQGVLDESFDLVVVAGGSWAARKPVGAWGEVERGHLPRELSELHARGTAMASVCTGAMLLSAAGITRGRPATTHHVAHVALEREGAQLVDARVVDDGDLVTAGGVTAGLDLAFWLVERHFGAELAAAVARAMEYERTGEVFRAGERAAPGDAGPAA